MRRLLFASLVCAMSARAYADDVKTADDKFSAASKLREEGKNEAACEMFSESLALNPNAIGTILNVARCAEEANHVATAIHYFTDAQSRAREQGLGPQLAAAEEHLAKLTPRASHLAIAFAERLTADSKLIVQDRVVEPAAASDILVDAGPVVLTVSEPGRVSYTATISIAEGAHQALAIPALAYPVTVRNTRRTVGKITVAGGAVIGASAVIVGLIARSRYNDATSACEMTASKPLCTKSDYDRAQSAVTLGNVGTGLGIAGVAILVGGAALWYFSPNPSVHEHPVAIVPLLSPTEAGLAAITRF